MSETNEKKDDLLELIDSLDIDDDLNRKMDLFTQRKRSWESQKEKESKKEDTQEVILSSGDTIKPPVRNSSAGNGTKTIVFEKPADPPKDAGGTVVIGEKEIKSFIEEENVIPQKKDTDVSNTANSNKKIFYIIFTVFLGLLLCFGVYRFASGFFSKGDDTTEQRKEYYTEIKAWAEKYDTLTDEEKAQIVDLEAKFNKLDDDQKAEINAILKEKTGLTFDELLANAKSGEQSSKKNNNTELAEQKAELKKQISDLESQLSQAETDLNTAKDEMDAAQVEFDNWAATVDSSASALSQAATDYQNAYDSSENPDSDENVKKAYEAYTKAESKYNSDYASYTNSYSALQEKQVNYQNAQSTYDSIYAQYQDLQAQLAALDN